MPKAEKFSEVFKRWIYFPKTKIDYLTFRKLRSLKTRTVGNKGWDEWLKYLARDATLSPTLHERVQEGTRTTLLNNWMKNFADNLPYIRFGQYADLSIPKEYHQQTIADLVEPTPILEMESEYPEKEGLIEEKKFGNEMIKVKNPPRGSAIVIGRGPSLYKHKHLKILHDSGYEGLIAASDGALISCLEEGVIPDIVVTVDGSPVIKKYFDHPLVKKYGPEIKWCVSVTVHHDVFLAAKEIGMPVYWFSPTFDDWRQHESWTRLQVLMTVTDKFEQGIPRAQSGGNAGACTWIMSFNIYKRSPIALIGIDFGYPEEIKLEDTQYFSSVLNIAEGNVGIVKEAYKEFYHPYFKTKAYCDFVFYHYRQAFLEMNQETPPWYNLYGGTINATEGGTLFGLGIENMYFADFLKEHKN